MVPFLAVVVVVLQRLRRIFRRLIEGQPFLSENASNLRFIGFAVLSGELVWAAFVYWGTRIVVEDFATTGITLEAQFSPRMPVLLAGLVLLIVAEIFRQGAQMPTRRTRSSERPDSRRWSPVRATANRPVSSTGPSKR